MDSEDIKLVILNIMMPGMDGLALCKKFVKIVPFIIMLSAKSTVWINYRFRNKSDYVTKPFNHELTARVKSQLRRYTKFNPGSHEEKQEKEIVLSSINE